MHDGWGYKFVCRHMGNNDRLWCKRYSGPVPSPRAQLALCAKAKFFDRHYQPRAAKLYRRLHGGV